ncbi:hypothetical protein NL676_034077 [Syzygium grande]|nr:hypothetical protein NL676_034077 [Syzygium grande]
MQIRQIEPLQIQIGKARRKSKAKLHLIWTRTEGAAPIRGGSDLREVRRRTPPAQTPPRCTEPSPRPPSLSNRTLKDGPNPTSAARSDPKRASLLFLLSISSDPELVGRGPSTWHRVLLFQSPSAAFVQMEATQPLWRYCRDFSDPINLQRQSRSTPPIRLVDMIRKPCVEERRPWASQEYAP